MYASAILGSGYVNPIDSAVAACEVVPLRGVYERDSSLIG